VPLFASLTRIAEARLHRAGRRFGVRLALMAGLAAAALLFLGFALAALTVALAERHGVLNALLIMAAAGLGLVLILLLALSIEARRHRRVAARQQPLDRQFARAAALSAMPARLPSRTATGLGLVALGAFLVLARRDRD
jgi:hypothetical protein